MKKATALVVLSLLILSGCGTRSISDSGYKEGGYYGYGDENPFYEGELSEFDILGIDAGKEYTEKQIANELNKEKERLSLRKGDSILLIQSGAIIPDQDMIENMEHYFSVSVFTGIPENNPEDKKKSNISYSRVLRYSAAKAGIQKIFVYWGVLEAGSKNLATKIVSWVPIAGWGIPNESQEIRIRLKVALVDVKTGQWDIFTPKVFEDKAYSARANRAASDQEQVALLKSMAYKAAVEGALARYTQQKIKSGRSPR
ncbi:MAG: aminopeptidase [Gammaproteobacteria bacterium]|nr:aminopeptidase [Gammaproteobacteria bacterium]